jgi:glycosyltransferase involved in cell wall biosynthesis
VIRYDSWNRAAEHGCAGREAGGLSLTPRVSVVLPVRDCERYVAHAIRSIVEQTFRNLELIVVDDGSCDRTFQILAEWAALDHRVQVLAQARSGLVAALEAGRAVARGFFIARMDADDIAVPERLRRQVKYLDRHPEVVAVGGQIELIDVEGRSLGCRAFPMTPTDCRAYLDRGAPFCHPAVMMRSKALAIVGGYRSSFEPAEDMDLWLRLSKIGELANLNAKVLRYRVHAASMTRTYAASQAAATALALVTVRFPEHANAGVTAGVDQNTWANIEARLPEPTRCYARQAYLRALSLNGGIVNPEDLALLYTSLPTFVREAADKRVLAFCVTRATYQLWRARKWQEAGRLTLMALALLPISVFAELSADCAARLARRLAPPGIRQHSTAMLERISTVRHPLGCARVVASVAAALAFLAIGVVSLAQRAIGDSMTIVAHSDLDLDLDPEK